MPRRMIRSRNRVWWGRALAIAAGLLVTLVVAFGEFEWTPLRASWSQRVLLAAWTLPLALGMLTSWSLYPARRKTRS